MQAVAQGQDISLRRLDQILSNQQVAALPAQGHPLDPHTMRAAELDQRPDLANGLVTGELRKGYTWQGELLRLAEVKVNRKPEPPQPATEMLPDHPPHQTNASRKFMTEKIIGIDLGTTNSEVAVVENGRVTVIDTSPGNPILPSFVGLGDDGSILVGEPAKNQYVLYPERTIRSIKRRMGSADRVQMGDDSYTPQEISAIILRRLKAIAEAHLGETIHKAVITVPAYFSDAQRQATREAGEIAGLEVMRIINEPTAAALSYEANHQGHKRVLVYDLGGGTFDVSVVGIEDNVVEVLASHGNNHLGGDDFDAQIVEHIVEHLKGLGADPNSSRRAMARITRAAEIAKIALSDQPYTRIEEEYLLEKAGAPVNLSLELSRHEYEDMIAGYIDETLEAVHIALKGANLTVSDIDEVLLVGGATRTPVITQRLEEDLGLMVRAEVNPDLCVATGAAIQAAMLAGETVSAVLVDITPYTFGTSALSE